VRWIECDDNKTLRAFCEHHRVYVADDHTGAPVFLARSDWYLEHAADDFPGVRFAATRDAAKVE